MDRRNFIKSSAIFGGALAAMGPFQALSARRAMGNTLPQSEGYGALVNKGHLWLPPEFNYQIISVQGTVMSDGQLTPGIFDGMAAFPGPKGNTILIRNHENREQSGEIKVTVPDALQYNVAARGGNTKLEVRRQRAGKDPETGLPIYAYEVVRDFAILGGTSTNCAGGVRSPHTWITCEEVVKRLNGKKHGYIFEIDAWADGPVAAVPVPHAGRRAHEAAVEAQGIVYMTEDRGITSDPVLGSIGCCFYRYVPSPRGNQPLAETTGPLQALKLRDEFHANMNTGRIVGVAYRVEWVDVDEPDHDDDTDIRTDRVSGFTSNRIQAQDKGAAYFSRLEGMWAGPVNGNAVTYAIYGPFNKRAGSNARRLG